MPQLALALNRPAAPVALPGGGDRISRDRYYTPDRLARAIISAVHAEEPITGRVMEPHAGGGAFVRALWDLTDAYVSCYDINPDAPVFAMEPPAHCPPMTRMSRDFMEHPGVHQMKWVIGNPPYCEAEAHTRHALKRIRHLGGRHVVFLLRAAFVESQARRAFWQIYPARHIWFLAERPSFTGSGTDNAAYAVFWWDRQHTGPTTCTPGWSWKQSIRHLGD